MRRRTGYVQDRGTSFRIAYYGVDGVRHFESFKTRDEAERELAQRLADIAKGVPVSAKPSTVTFAELAADVVADYKVNGRKSIEDLKCRFRMHINPVFGGRKAAQITTAQLNHYIVGRKETGASTGTINRELEAIRHTFLLARKHGKLFNVAHVPHLKENNTRSGFFTAEEVDRLCSHLKPPLDSFVRFAFLTGWRYSEIQNLRWSHVDFVSGGIRLDPGTTKSGEGRVFPMNGELRSLLESLIAKPSAPVAPHSSRLDSGAVVMKERMVTVGTAFVFSLRGKPIGAFRKSWKTACYKAGLPCIVLPIKKGGKKGAVKVLKSIRIFHDLRRSAAREFQRQGFTEGQIMRMCGWATRSVFDRYAIVTDSDIREKMEQISKASGAPRRPAGSAE